MPCTTTQNTIGATIIEISFRKASLKIFSSTAKSGVATPRAIPSSKAARTCTKSDRYRGFRTLPTVVEMVDMIGLPVDFSLNSTNTQQHMCQKGPVSRVFRRDLRGGPPTDHAG